MFDKGTTWPPRNAARARQFSGSKAPTITDGQERARASSEPAAAAPGDSRPTEAHWQSVIDRATD